MSSSEDDRRLIGLSLALGRRNLGLTWPNPSVGAVLVQPDTGAIISTATTSPGGRPHAEPIALREAGERARGATLYVSLEPCSHHGRTPPCAEAIAGSGVARVVTAIDDPDPRVAGRGHAMIRAAGIDVTSAVAPGEGFRAHIGHITRIRLGRPAVTCKLAMTADGFAADLGPGRLMITGDGANTRTHMLRAYADGILVGINTVLVDDPRLDVRLPGIENRTPVRIVLDSRLRLLPASRVLKAGQGGSCWIVCAEDADIVAEGRIVAAGGSVVRVPRDANGRVSLPDALRELAARGLTRILCEAGPTLADALAAHDLIDELVLIRNVRSLGREGLPALGPRLSAALQEIFAAPRSERVGEDAIQTYERHGACSPAS